MSRRPHARLAGLRLLFPPAALVRACVRHDFGWERDHPTAPAIANPRPSATQVRAVAAELPGPVSLEDALAILQALVDREPETFPRAAARWGGRLVVERRLPLVDA